LEFSVLSSLGHNPELLIADNSAKERQLITTLQNRETELTKQITKLISLSDDMDLAELKQKLNKLKSEREAVKSALETARGNIAVNGNPETAVEEIENIVGNKLNALKFFASIQSVLSDIEKRAKLARVIPQLISKVELDFNKMEQTTTLKTGHAVETICFHDLQTGITEGF
jgi:DNA repair exonuclease SbcCD ATPase subunit